MIAEEITRVDMWLDPLLYKKKKKSKKQGFVAFAALLLNSARPTDQLPPSSVKKINLKLISLI